jgi:Rrf2 family transcriptional regulator, nitric oxide-sensitive transcriptional repressor
MWLNQQTLDAIKIMAEVAQHEPQLCNASTIAINTNITFMNVQKTVHALKVANLLETTRGRGGGIKCARDSTLISIGEIVRALEPIDCPVSFLTLKAAQDPVSKLLFQAHRGFFRPLEETTLNSILLKN